MKEKILTMKAEFFTRIAGFILKKHQHPLLQRLAIFAAWLNRKQYGNDALDFLEHEDSKDHLDYSDEDAQ